MSDLAGGTNVLRKVLGSPSGRPETLKARHEKAMKDCDEFERYLDAVLARFQLITRVDEMWNAGVARGSVEYDNYDEQEISGYYREWLVVAEAVALELEDYRTSGFTFPHSEEFLTCLVDARGICTSDEEFFAGSNLEAVRDRAIADHHAGESVEIQDSRD